MRQLLIIAAATGGLSFTFGGENAVAGYCGSAMQPVTCQRPIAPPPPPCGYIAPPPMMARPAPMPQCQTPVVVQPGAAYATDPIVVSSAQPMGYLRSIKFRNSPHINIMRVHGQTSGVGLKDAPTGFTGGCHPSSTTYCGQQTPARVAAPRPYVAPPLPAPVKVVQRPRHQYGSTELVRGTAYLPTSNVNRDHQTAVNVLNSSSAKGGQVPHLSMFNGLPYTDIPYHANGGPIAMRPAPVAMPLSIAQPMPNPRPAFGPGPGNWEQVSGPTMVGNLPATKVVCRRPAPMPAPVTCVRQVLQAPLTLAGGPRGHAGNSRYGSGH